MWKCPNCETINEDDADRFCMICGSPRVAAEAPRPAEYSFASMPPAPPAPPARYENPFAAGPYAPVETLKSELGHLERAVAIAKAAAVAITLVALMLGAVWYGPEGSIYDIALHNDIYGIVYGSVEQIATIVILLFTLAPALFLMPKYSVRSRSLPVTISSISLALSCVYCVTLAAGVFKMDRTPGIFLWLHPVLMTCLLLLSIYTGRKAKQIENAMFRRTTFSERRAAPDMPPPAYTPYSAPGVPASPASPAPGLKSTMRKR